MLCLPCTKSLYESKMLDDTYGTNFGPWGFAFNDNESIAAYRADCRAAREAAKTPKTPKAYELTYDKYDDYESPRDLD